MNTTQQQPAAEGELIARFKAAITNNVLNPSSDDLQTLLDVMAALEGRAAAPAKLADAFADDGKVIAKVAVDDAMVERLAKHLCRKEYPSRSLDEVVSLSADRTLWMRFQTEAREYLEAAINGDAG